MNSNTTIYARTYEWEEEQTPTQIIITRREQDTCSILELEVTSAKGTAEFTIFVNKDDYPDFPTYDSNSTSEGNKDD